jgi:hypothetical protein
MSVDKRLTNEEKKKIKPVNQGGGPNYLGKQETVTVPKKWLSDPDHVVAELAYITPREQKILLNANIYGSLKGKPNKGPGGIMSLQGDLGGYDASPGGPNDGGSKGTSTESKSKQRAADIMTGKVNVSSPTGVTEGYKGPAPTGQSKFGDFVGPSYKGDVGGFDDKGVFSTSFAPTKTKNPFSLGNIVTNIALGILAPQLLGPKFATGMKAYNIAKTASKFANDIGLTDKNVVGAFTDNLTSNLSDKFSGFGKGKSKGTTSTNNTNNGGKGEGEGLASLENQAGSYDEYILLLQKLQSGNISDAERNRFNVLKNMLGI